MDSFFAPSLLLETYNAFEKETPTIFTVEVPRSFICAICCEILKEAVFLKCGHSFCSSCIKRSLRTKLECPLDRKSFEGEIDDLLSPNFLARDHIGSLTILCPWGLKKSQITGEWIKGEGGCSEIIQYQNKNKHEKECSFRIVRCPNIDEETNEICGVVCLKKDLPEHQLSCEFNKVFCPNGCSSSTTKKRLASHMEKCPYDEIECDRGCGSKFKRRKVEEHICENVKCLFEEFGCSFKCRQEDLQKHLNDFLSTHLLLFMKEFKKNSTVPTNSFAKVSELYVSVNGGFKYTSIQSAVNEAAPGDRILVYPGQYRETVTLKKPVHIIGVGSRTDIIVSQGSDVVFRCLSDGGSITNLTIEKDDNGKHVAIWIASGSITIEKCCITSRSLSCVEMKCSSSRILNNNIFGSKMSGILITYSSNSTIENNLIHENELNGISVDEGSNPTIIGNSIYDNKQTGVHVRSNASGTVTKNRIYGNHLNGICIQQASPIVTENVIYNNELNGIRISDHSNPIVRKNHVTKCMVGFQVEDSFGIVENNTIAHNLEFNMDVKEGVLTTIANNDCM